MAFTFPTNPTNGDTTSIGTITYVYNSTDNTWKTQSSSSSGGGASVTVSDTAPSSPSEGDMWFDSTTATTYVYYGTSWVSVAGPNAGSNGAGGASVTISDTAPTNPSAGDLWWESSEGIMYVYYTDADSNQWVSANSPGADGAAGADGGGVSSYTNLAAFPSTENTLGDLGVAQDTKALYMWDGTAWARIQSGADEDPDWVTEPPATLNLSPTGATSTITVEASDPDGFGITYDYDTSPSNQTQATIVNNNDGSFTLTPSTNTSDEGEFSLRIKASDGLNVIRKISSIGLAFSSDILFSSGTQTSAFIGSVSTSYTSTTISDSPLKSGKYYIESIINSYTAATVPFFAGIVDSGNLTSSYTSAAQAAFYQNGNVYWGGAVSTGMNSLIAGTIIGVCYDTSTREVWFSRNGVWYQDPATTSSTFVLTGTGDFYYGFMKGNSSTTSIDMTFHTGTNKNSRVYSIPTGFLAY